MTSVQRKNFTGMENEDGRGRNVRNIGFYQVLCRITIFHVLNIIRIYFSRFSLHDLILHMFISLYFIARFRILVLRDCITTAEGFVFANKQVVLDVLRIPVFNDYHSRSYDRAKMQVLSSWNRDPSLRLFYVEILAVYTCGL